MNYSPIFITVYNREYHFKRCIESLKKNKGAENAPLYIAIDFPSKEVDVLPHKKIVEYAKNISRFKAVELFIRDKNIGAFENARKGWLEVLSIHDALIRAEDDNVFSPSFIQFVTAGLNLHKDNPRIFAICGYSEPIGLPGPNGSYFRKGFSSYGFATWKDRYEHADTLARDFYSEFSNPLKVREFFNAVGQNIFVGLVVAKRNKRIYPDMAYVYHVFKEGLYSVHPKVSLVRNIGQDGSGIQSGVNVALQEQEISADFISAMPDSDCEPEEIRARLNDYYRQPASVLALSLGYYYWNSVKQKMGLD